MPVGTVMQPKEHDVDAFRLWNGIVKQDLDSTEQIFDGHARQSDKTLEE